MCIYTRPARQEQPAPVTHRGRTGDRHRTDTGQTRDTGTTHCVCTHYSKMSGQRFSDKPPLLVPVFLLALYTTAVFAALEKGGGDCSAGADQAAKNDICGGPTKGFCVDSKTSKAACACFDAYEGPLCQTLATPTTSSTGSSSAGKNALTALALGLGGAYLLNSLTNQQGFRNNKMDQYLLSGAVNPYLAAQNAAATASSLDGLVGTGTGAAFPFPVNTAGSYPVVLTGPPKGKFQG